MHTNNHTKAPLKPKPSKGYLYYVRLDTSLGIFYKLGFTTLGSTQERFAYQGKGHDSLVDHVLLFSYRDDAYEVEQLLHTHFRNEATFRNQEKGMPFFENGQSELYVNDILEMDWEPAKGKRSAEETRANIMTAREKRFGRSDEEIRERSDEIREQLAMERNILDVTASLARTFGWLIRGYHSIVEWYSSENEKVHRAQVRKVLTELQEYKEEHWRKWRRRKSSIMKDPQEGLKADVRDAIAAFKRKDLQAFENIIHVPLFAHNLADAMTADMSFVSDYMVVANNCGLLALIKAMEEESPRDLLLRPVEETYKAVLRGLVKSHRLLREDINMPDDPKYQACVPEGDYEFNSISNYYGPGSFLKLFGREWTLQDNPSFEVGVGSLEFQIECRNHVTGFRNFLTVNAMYVTDNKVSLSFPNFLDLDEAACMQMTAWEKSTGLRDPNEQELAHRNHFRKMYAEA